MHFSVLLLCTCAAGLNIEFLFYSRPQSSILTTTCIWKKEEILRSSQKKWSIMKSKLWCLLYIMCIFVTLIKIWPRALLMIYPCTFHNWAEWVFWHWILFKSTGNASEHDILFLKVVGSGPIRAQLKGDLIWTTPVKCSVTALSKQYSMKLDVMSQKNSIKYSCRMPEQYKYIFDFFCVNQKF